MTTQSLLLNQVLILLASLIVLFQTSPDSCGQKKNLAFEKYLATEIYSCAPHTAILATAFDKQYRTVISEELVNGVNFAGHYVVVKWDVERCVPASLLLTRKLGLSTTQRFIG